MRRERDRTEQVRNSIIGAAAGMVGGSIAAALTAVGLLSLGQRLGIPRTVMHNVAFVPASAVFLGSVAAGALAGPVALTPTRRVFSVTPENIDLLRGEALRQASALGLRPSASAGAVADRLFARYDTDRDGTLGPDEGTSESHSARALLDAADRRTPRPDNAVQRDELVAFITEKYVKSTPGVERIRADGDIYEFEGFLVGGRLGNFERDFGPGGEFPR